MEGKVICTSRVWTIPALDAEFPRPSSPAAKYQVNKDTGSENHAGNNNIHAEEMIIHAVKFKCHAVNNYSRQIVISLKYSDKNDKKVPIKTIDIFMNIILKVLVTVEF